MGLERATEWRSGFRRQTGFAYRQQRNVQLGARQFAVCCRFAQWRRPFWISRCSCIGFPLEQRWINLGPDIQRQSSGSGLESVRWRNERTAQSDLLECARSYGWSSGRRTGHQPHRRFRQSDEQCTQRCHQRRCQSDVGLWRKLRLVPTLLNRSGWLCSSWTAADGGWSRLLCSVVEHGPRRRIW